MIYTTGNNINNNYIIYSHINTLNYQIKLKINGL